MYTGFKVLLTTTMVGFAAIKTIHKIMQKIKKQLPENLLQPETLIDY